MSLDREPGSIRLALPKGRMYDQVVSLLKGAGISVRQSARGYRPIISLPNFTTKLLKPRDVIGMLKVGARDMGFAGEDWIQETGTELVELLDTGLNPVRLVVAAPTEILENGKLPSRKIVIATEYPMLAKQWVTENGVDAEILQTFGATEVFPPEDADCIIDNTATGSTLRANGLQIIDDVMTSSTRLYASKEAVADPERKKVIDDFVLLIDAVLQARSRVMMDMNVQQKDLDAVLAVLPSLQRPTVSPLSDSDWLAIRSAIPRKELAAVIPKLKTAGASSIVTSTVEQLIS